jgi:hypothetical protein
MVERRLCIGRVVNYSKCNNQFPYDTEHPKARPDTVVIVNTSRVPRRVATACANNKTDFVTDMQQRPRLTTETVEGAALTLESVDNVKRGDGLALGVLGVGDGVTDDTLEEGLEDSTGLLVDHGRDTLDTTTTSETSDGGLGDTLDVVTKNLAVTLGAALAETLAALAASSHDEGLGVCCVVVVGCGCEVIPWMLSRRILR